MASFVFKGQRLDTKLVADISSLLDSAGVPHLLWGNFLLTVYGVPTVVDGVSFVVPDNLISVAFLTLLRARFPRCSEEESCAHSDSLLRPAPHVHLHINDELAVSLYRKSEILLAFPDFNRLPLDAKNPNIMQASDTRLPPARLGRGAGRFPPSLYPVWIPTPIKYCEALIHLACRDRGGNYQSFWIVMLTYVLEYIDGAAIFDEAALSQPYRHFYRAIKQGDPKMFPILDEVRGDLIKSGMLPPTVSKVSV